MPTACLNQSNIRVQLSSERLMVYQLDPETGRDELLRELPLRDLDRIITGENVHFTAPAMAEILRRGIPIQFFSWAGKFLGNFLPAQNQHGLARLRQYQQTLDGNFALQMSGRIIAAKLYNQRRVLQRLGANRTSETPEVNESPDGSEPEINPPATAFDGLKATLDWLDALFASLRNSKTIDELRGYEGAATARYFNAWSGFLPEAFPFERRSTRPPLNPVNACISFGSTLVYNEMVAYVHARGLDPALGMLHTTENGRWSLALDLIEPFRPVLVEALALDLFSHQMLGQAHFEDRNQGVYLNEQGRRKFLLQYERRMERQFMSECAGHRTTLRQQLEQQAVMFKAALEDAQKFEPFLMN
jgi:CRISP-associated protein Cas1